jgi:hypothetical protein
MMNDCCLHSISISSRGVRNFNVLRLLAYDILHVIIMTIDNVPTRVCLVLLTATLLVCKIIFPEQLCNIDIINLVTLGYQLF